MTNITDYKHRFLIGTDEIELTISFKDGVWMSEITKGQTGTGVCSGGKYENLSEYISSQESQHRYSYNFFNHGYDYAKKHIK